MAIEKVEITLVELANDRKFTFPYIPERISTKGSAEYKSYDTISLGTVKIPRGTWVKNISWSGVLLGESKKKEKMAKKWKSPKQCKKMLENWRDKGAVLNLVVSGTSINYDVTIESFDGEDNGAFGNFDYSISFVVKKDLKVYTMEEWGGIDWPIRRPPKEENGLYFVKQGDSLWRIAQRKLNNSSRYIEIYHLNKEQIERTARKYGRKSSDKGRYIYPGEKLKLPSNKGGNLNG